MIFATLLAVFALPAALAQNPSGIESTGTPIKFDQEHNYTNIIGSWASGSRNVTTGPNFANPAQMSFTYPAVAGVAYAFDGDGNYELSRYRFVSNGSHPNCITGTLIWAHGQYNILQNGSIILVPLGDGFQQVQAACEGESNFIQVYNYTEYFPQWRIFNDPTDGPKLHLWQFDGQPVAPLFQTSTTPNMLPTTLLRNITEDPSAGTTVLNQRRKRSLWKRSAAPRSAAEVGVGAAALVFGAAALATMF